MVREGPVKEQREKKNGLSVWMMVVRRSIVSSAGDALCGMTQRINHPPCECQKDAHQMTA